MNFCIATYDDNAGYGDSDVRLGFNLVTDNNAQPNLASNDNYVLKSIIVGSGKYEVSDNQIGNLQNSTEDAFSDQQARFHDFPTGDKDKSDMIGGNNGILKMVIKQQ